MTHWHFAAHDGTNAVINFGPPTPIHKGTRITATGELWPCLNGAHASERALDALSCAQGTYVSRVSLSRERLIGSNKVCARWRKHLDEPRDALPILRAWVVWCAQLAHVYAFTAAKD